MKPCALSRNEGHKEPWNALWGRRYTQAKDPDGNVVDLFAPSRADAAFSIVVRERRHARVAGEISAPLIVKTAGRC